MKINLFPKTASGKWATILSITFIILITLKLLCPFLMPSFLIAALGLAGFVAGIIAVIKRERAILAYLSIPVGLLIVLWIAAEIIYPH